MKNFFLELSRSYVARRPLLLLLFVYATGLLFLSRCDWWRRPSAHDPVHWAGQRVTLTGRVSAPPDFSPRGGTCLVEAESIQTETDLCSAQGWVRVQVGNVSPSFAEPGDRVVVRGRIVPPTPARIPGSFDFDEYLALRGVHSVIYTGNSNFQNLGDSRAHALLRWGWELNQEVVGVFTNRLKPEESAILSGLVAGRRPRFQTEVKRAFTESGTMHVLVASGSNIAFVVSLWYLFSRIVLRLPRRAALISSLPAVWAYAFLAGLDAPILRAALMTTVGFIAEALSRKDHPGHALGVAALVMLIFDPRLISDLGFQMSFLTVAGLLLTLPRLSGLFPSTTRGRYIFPLLAASLVAETWLFPLTVSVFKRIYPMSLLANIIVVPLSGGGLVIGLILFAADRLAIGWPGLTWIAQSTAFVANLYAKLIFILAKFFADHPVRVFWMPSFGAFTVSGYYLLLLSLVCFRKSKSSWIGLGLGGFLLAVGGILKPRPPTIEGLQATWIDVGRSLATLVETPSTNLLALSNPVPPSETWEKILMPYFAERQIHHLNGIVTPAAYSDFDKRRIEAWIPTGIWIEGDNPRRETIGAMEIKVLTVADSYTHQAPLLIRARGRSLLLTKGLGLRTQDLIIEEKIGHPAVLQGSFSERAKWRDQFLLRLRPSRVVENGFDSDRHPSCPPWLDVPISVPQKSGIFIWKETSSGEDLDEKN